MLCHIIGGQSLDTTASCLVGQCEVSFIRGMAAVQTTAYLVANVHVIHGLVTKVCEIQFDGDGTRRRDRNCTRESVRHGKTATSHTIQQLNLGPRRRQRTNQLPDMHKYRDNDYDHDSFQWLCHRHTLLVLLEVRLALHDNFFSSTHSGTVPNERHPSLLWHF